MEFNFDSTEHIAYVASPAAKAINAPAGIWVGFDNQQAAGWVEGKELDPDFSPGELNPETGATRKSEIGVCFSITPLYSQ
jgi:hypothetical protein